MMASRSAGPGRVRKRSAGLLVHRPADGGGIEVLVGHMGGPLWARRDVGAWTVPKGEYGDDEAPLDAARREFAEELGMPAPQGAVLGLGSVKQAGGKSVTVFAVRGDLDPAKVVPGSFEMEWPPKSGVRQRFPELDRVAWMTPQQAGALLVTAQRAFLHRLLGALAGDR